MLTGFLLPIMGQRIQDDQAGNSNERRQVKTLFGDHAKNGGYGAISLGYTEIDGRNGLMMGGRGAWIIGHGLGLGLGGYGFVNDPLYNADDGLYYSLAGGYGGFIFEPIIMGRWPIHLSLPILIGAGGVALTSYGEDIFTQLDTYDAYLEEASVFFVAEPAIELEFNLVRFFRVALYGSYRYTTKLYMEETNPKALNGWSAGITFKIGSF